MSMEKEKQKNKQESWSLTVMWKHNNSKIIPKSKTLHAYEWYDILEVLFRSILEQLNLLLVSTPHHSTEFFIVDSTIL
jgi:hypothetical protein